MDVSCKRWHSRAQTKLVPGRVESALVRFWTQCEGSKHCNKWILILTIPLRLNAILRNLKVKLFLEKRCKCFSFYNQCTRCSSKMSWLQWKVSKTPNRAYLRSCSFPNLSHSETLLPTNGGTWWHVWCNMRPNITPWFHGAQSIGIDFRLQTLPGKITPSELLTGRPSTSSSSS